MMYVRDLEDNEYLLQATSTNNYELNANQNLSMKILPTKVNEKFIDRLTEMWEVIDHDGVPHKIIHFKKRGEGKKLSVDIRAIPLFFDDMNRLRIYERYDEHMTAQACFNLIFEGSGYNFVLDGSFEAIEWEGFGEGDTRLTMFKDALNRYGAEFRIVGDTVYLENLIGRDTQFMYRHRLNASNIVLEHDASAMYTYAIGYGDYGDGEGSEDWQDANLIREYTSPLAEIPGIGIRHAPPIKNGNITDRDFMYEQLKTLVDESLKISVNATIHDLRKQGYALAQPEMGDRVFLIDERIGLDDEVRVVNMSLIRDWKREVLDINLTFGTPGLVKRHQAELREATQNIRDLLEGRRKLPFSVLDNAVANATKALQNMQSQLNIPDNGGLMAVDRSNPNNVVVFNAAGLGVSDDGGATFKNAITGAGINAEVIVAGTMLADRIAGGILRSLNGNFEFDLNGSRMDFYSGARIQFHSGNNHLFRNVSNNAAGIYFSTSMESNHPMMVVGTQASTSGSIDANSSNFTGLRVHNYNSNHASNFVVGRGGLFRFLSRADHSNGGIVVRTGYVNNVSRSLYPMDNPNNWTYNLGRAGSQWRWSNIYLKEQPDVQSDERLKKNIRDNPLGLDFIKRIATKEYVMKNTEDQRKRYGIIAQQLIKVLEESDVAISDVNIVNKGEDGMYGVQETQLIAPVIKSLQEIAKRLEVVENRTA